jgi:hypothetical protein
MRRYLSELLEFCTYLFRVVIDVPILLLSLKPAQMAPLLQCQFPFKVHSITDHRLGLNGRRLKIAFGLQKPTLLEHTIQARKASLFK